MRKSRHRNYVISIPLLFPKIRFSGFFERISRHSALFTYSDFHIGKPVCQIRQIRGGFLRQLQAGHAPLAVVGGG